MTDQTVVNPVSDKTENSEKTQPMSNEYTILNTLKVGDYTANWEENPNKTSQRIGLYNSARPEWISDKDYSVMSFTEQWATFHALSKFFGGEVHGSEKVVITAPPAKAFGEAPTGHFAYVRWDLDTDDPVEIVDANGDIKLIEIPGNCVPSNYVGAFRRVKLNPSGGFYCDPKDGYITPSGEVDVFTGEVKLAEKEIERFVNGKVVKSKVIEPDTYWFWHIAALSNLLEGRNVSISVPMQANSKLRAEAQRVWKILELAKADKIADAHDHKRFMMRTKKREQEVTQSEADVSRQETPDYTPTAGELMVPLAEGGEFDLATVEFGELVRLVDDTDFEFDAQSFVDDHGRKSLRQTILRNDWRVTLS